MKLSERMMKRYEDEYPHLKWRMSRSHVLQEVKRMEQDLEKCEEEVAKMKQIVEMAQKVGSINYGELIAVLPEILRLREVLDETT